MFSDCQEWNKEFKYLELNNWSVQFMPALYWERLLSYHSTQTIQKKLEKCYQNLSKENSSGLSYDNCYRFIYFLKHGENFFLQANQSPHAIQPILLFYGISQLLKACLLIKDPNYPSTSSVLAHGASSRKRKKQQYQFLKDEIKVQRNGLFSHVAKELFQIHDHLEAEKYSMELLLNQIAEMNDVLLFHQAKKNYVKVETTGQRQIILTDETAQYFHMSAERLSEYLGEKHHLEREQDATNDQIILRTKYSNHTFHCSPFLFHIENNSFYLPNKRESFLSLPELLVHYLLLYNLSMISRYETEWWYELLLGTSNDDYPIILRYMEIAKRKIPYFILEFLEEHL
ncbi:hypothetical protein CJ195_27115 [Bacillus sp. UMB0899]|nr:hypothetical protein CJ195_27115 [Bacillus sp. UMB0899]